MNERQPAQWQVEDDEYSDDPHCWSWGDWAIVLIDGAGFYLCVSSGVEYGPFDTFAAAQLHAENVRGD